MVRGSLIALVVLCVLDTARADDDLHFQSGDVHIRVIVKYTNYKRFGSESRIVFNGQAVPPGGSARLPWH